jgi:hypothetical protein
MYILTEVLSMAFNLIIVHGLCFEYYHLLCDVETAQNTGKSFLRFVRDGDAIKSFAATNSKTLMTKCNQL